MCDIRYYLIILVEFTLKKSEKNIYFVNNVT
jgi:hypothetical protein